MKAPEVGWNTITQGTFQSDNFLPNPHLWLLKSMKGCVEQTWTNQRSQAQVTSQPEVGKCDNIWHSPRNADITRWSNVAPYAKSRALQWRDVENEASFCWQQRIGITSTSRLLCLQFNHWTIRTWLLLMLIASSSGHWDPVGLRRFAQGGRYLAGDFFHRLVSAVYPYNL